MLSLALSGVLPILAAGRRGERGLRSLHFARTERVPCCHANAVVRLPIDAVDVRPSLEDLARFLRWRLASQRQEQQTRARRLKGSLLVPLAPRKGRATTSLGPGVNLSVTHSQPLPSRLKKPVSVCGP